MVSTFQLVTLAFLATPIVSTSTFSPTPRPSAIPTSAPSLVPRFYFGQSGPLTTLLEHVAADARDGTMAAFRKINDEGGINGHLLDLISYDDMGQSDITQLNTQSFIDQKVVACVSYKGLEGITASLPMLEPHAIPMIAPFSGARTLRLPVSRYIFNTRASLDEEAHAWVTYCIARGIMVFSVYYQDDDDGVSGLEAMKFALANEGLKLLSTASFPAGSSNVSIAELASVSIDPQAIVVLAPADPAAKFIKLAKAKWPKCLLYAPSFLGPPRFLASLAENNVSVNDTKDVFLTQVVPIPQLSTNLPAVGALWEAGRSSLLQDFAKAMNVTCPGCNLTFAQLEGFVAGSFVGSILEHMRDFNYANPLLRPYLDAAGVNASSVSLDDELSMQAWRKLLIDTIYKEEIFDVSGLRLGPYVANITCPSNSADCIQPEDLPCSQGMRHVYLIQPSLNNNTYVELPEWRMQSPSCNFHSIATPPDRLPLVFGQSALLSGASAGLGVDIRNGILAAFAQANKSPSKGVRSRKLLLLSLDDFYSDAQAAINAKALINNQSLVAVVGAVGADPTLAAVPLYAAAGLPLIGTTSGDRTLRDTWAINIRAFYDDEAAAMVDFAVSRGLRKISLFRQLAAFGQSGFDAVNLALQYNKLQLHTASGHPRGVAPDYPAAMYNLTRGGAPEALIMFVSLAIATTFIEKALNDTAWANTVFICASISDVDRFQTRLSPAAIKSGRVYSSTVVPAVGNDTFSKEYLEALKLIDSRLFFGQPYAPTLVSLEGYLIGRLVIAALARVTEFTGSAMLTDIHVTQGITINNFKLGPYTPQCNMGLRSVYIVRVDNGTLTQMEEFRPKSSNELIPDCGALSLYSDANFSCPDGYEKVYVSSASLDSRCRLCLSAYGCNIPELVPNKALRSGMLALNIIGFFVSLIFFGIVVKFRTTVTIRAVSPPFCLLILLGAMFGHTFIFVQYPEMPTEQSCMAQVYILNTACCLLFGSLFAKVFRVTQIFKPRPAKSFRVLAIQDSALYIGVGSMWIVEMIYTVVWHSFSPLVPVHLTSPTQQYWICQADDDMWGIIDVLANAMFLLYGVLLSVQSRRVPTLFNEAKFVAATMYNTLIVGGIAVLLGFGLADNDDELYLYKGLGCFVVFTVDIGLLIGSKFPSLYGELVKGIIPEFKNDSSSNTSGKDTTTENKSSRDSAVGKSAAPLSRIELEVAPERRSPTISEEPNKTQPRSPAE